MLRNSSLFIVLFVLLANVLKAQKLFLSPAEYINTNSGQVKVIGNVGDFTACFLEGEAGTEIIWYDSIMRRAGGSSLDFIAGSTAPIKFYTTSSAAYVFYQRKKRKKLELWAARVVPQHKDTIIPVLIDSAQLSNNWDDVRFEVHESLQPNRFIYSFTNYVAIENKLTVQATLLDQAFKPLNVVNETIDDIVFHSILSIRTDPFNGLHILFGEPDMLNGGIQHVLIGSKSTSATFMRYNKLDLNQYRLRGGQLIFDKASNQLYFGCLMHQSGSEVLDALGIFSYDPTTQSWQDRKFALLGGLKSTEQQRLNNLRLRKFSMRADGGAIFVTEKVFEETYQRNRSIGFVTPGLGMISSTYSVFHNDEIVVFNTDPDGQLAWHEVILKSQETADANERFHSFGLLEYPLGQVYLYTEKRNNTDRFITAYLSNKGSLRLKQFQTTAYQDIEEAKLLLRSAQQLTSNEIVFPVIYRGTISFAKIIF